MILVCFNYCDTFTARYMLVPYNIFVDQKDFHKYLEDNGYGLICIKWVHFIDTTKITLIDDLKKEIRFMESLK